MAKAQYNNGIELLVLEVLKKNPDGTLELSADGETLKVGKCPVDDSDGDKPAVGTARVIKDAPAPAPPSASNPSDDGGDAAGDLVKGAKGKKAKADPEQ